MGKTASVYACAQELGFKVGFAKTSGVFEAMLSKACQKSIPPNMDLC